MFQKLRRKPAVEFGMMMLSKNPESYRFKKIGYDLLICQKFNIYQKDLIHFLDDL